MTTETPKNGLHIEYYDSGQTRVELNYKDGKQDCKRTEWYENGQKRYEGNYEDGNQDGKSTKV